jgi:hypothetical protein
VAAELHRVTVNGEPLVPAEPCQCHACRVTVPALEQRNRDLERALRQLTAAETGLHRVAEIARMVELHDPGRGF